MPFAGESPSGRLLYDASPGAQHIAGDGQIVGRLADVMAGIVQH